MRPTMNYMKLTTALFAAAAMAASSEAAEADYYLTFGPLKPGTSSAKVREAAARAEVTSWSWGLSQGGALKKIKVELYVEDRAVPSATPATPATPSDIRPVAGDVNGDGRAAVTPPRDAASGATTAKRQHGWNTVSKSLDRGSVTAKGKFPGCAIGAQYDGATLGDGARALEFNDIQVTSCAVDSISFNYASYRESPTRQSQK